MMNDGGPAFPGKAIHETATGNGETLTVEEWQGGMSLLDYFAGQAMLGYRAAAMRRVGAYPSETKLWSSRDVARFAVQDAQALIIELELERQKKEKPDGATT